MLIAAGVAAVVAALEGIVIYEQSNAISQLKDENTKMLEGVDARVKKIEQEKNTQIAISKAESQKTIDELTKANKELSKKFDASEIRIKELIEEGEKSRKDSEASRKAMEEMTAMLGKMLGIPGVHAAVQAWNEADNTSHSNLSEPHSEPSAVKSSEEQNCTADISESDIEIIEYVPPSSSMSELTLRCSVSNQR